MRNNISETKRTLTFIKRILSRMHIPFEENYSFSAIGIDGKLYEREFAFKIGSLVPLYIDFYPDSSLNWYDKNKYVAKSMIVDEAMHLSIQTGIKIILISEGQDRKLIKKVLKEVNSMEGVKVC